MCGAGGDAGGGAVSEGSSQAGTDGRGPAGQRQGCPNSHSKSQHAHPRANADADGTVGDAADNPFQPADRGSLDHAQQPRQGNP